MKQHVRTLVLEKARGKSAEAPQLGMEAASAGVSVA